MRRSTAFWLPVSILLTGAAIASIAVIANGRLGETDGRVILSVLAALLTGGAAIAPLELIGRRRLRALAWLVLLGVPVEFAFMELAVWTFVDEGENRYMNWGWTALVWVLPTLVIPTMLLFTRNLKLTRTVVPTVSVCAIAVAGLLTGIIWTEGNHDAVGRVTAALAIVAVAGYLITPAFERSLPQAAPRS